MSDSNAILQAIRVLKAQGVLPNLNKAQNEALPSLVSGDGADEYVFYLPGRQQAGVPTDYSGKGRNAIRKSGLTEAESWANVGWMTTKAASDGSIAVADTAIQPNYSTDILVYSTRVKMPTPVANTAFAGIGANPTPHGFYLSARTSGKIQVIVTSSAGLYAPGDIPGVIFDSTEHTVGLVLNGPAKTYAAYIDGGLAFYASGITLGGASTLALGYSQGVSFYTTGAQTAVETIMREVHYLKFAAMPLNMDEIMLRFATRSGRLQKSDIRVA